jgi:hypothetical protein
MSDYLWDKTGAPDPEIERLEALLGELRFHSSTLKMPVPAPPLRIATLKSPRQTFTPYLAIAATLAFLTIAGGLWLSLHSQNRVTEQASPVARKNAPAPIEAVISPDDTTAKNNLHEDQTVQSRQLNKVNKKQSVVAAASQGGAVQRPNSRTLEANSLNAKASRTLHILREQQERARGEEAKDQLIMALRLASAKLNLAQKKVQGKPETISSHS